jgi:acyl CoA:acetate/3-ketoacid CoA transferase beta subunit
MPRARDHDDPELGLFENGVVRLPGSGGACDIASLAKRFVLTSKA